MKNIRLSFECTKVLGEDYSSISDIVHRQTWRIIENYKQKVGVIQPTKEKFVLLLWIRNSADFDINNLEIKMDLIVNLSNSVSTDIISLNFIAADLIVRDEVRQLILCDFSGFPEVLLRIANVEYQAISTRILERKYTSNTPLLIKINDLGEPFYGYRNRKEMETGFLLQNYLNNGFICRGWLLKFLFNLLDHVDDPDFELDGKRFSANNQLRVYFKAFIHIDIISKIMMYIEDLVIIMEGMIRTDGNYYDLLGERKMGRKSYDVGKEIGRFFNSLDGLSSYNLQRMLNYMDPNKVDVNDSGRAILTKLITSNTEGFRYILGEIKKFAVTHHPLFRMYKHAGFPFYAGYISRQKFPHTQKVFDWYSLVFRGSDPLENAIPIPFSTEVLSSYKTMIRLLTDLITAVVGNKLECILRRTEGTIPTQKYYKSDAFSVTDESTIDKLINDFYNENPRHAYEVFLEFPLNAEKDQVQWYVELDKYVTRPKN